MELSPPRATGQEFARYAGGDIGMWHALVGCTIIHNEHGRGPGLVEEVIPRGVATVLLRVIHQGGQHTPVERKYIATAENFGNVEVVLTSIADGLHPLASNPVDQLRI